MDLISNQYWTPINYCLRKRKISSCYCRKTSQVFSIPAVYLRWDEPGKRLARDGLELSHDFCSRFGHLIPAGWIELPEPLQEPWLRGKDINREVLVIFLGTELC